MITLTPGVVLTATAYNNQGQFSVNGQRSDSNYFTVDGVSLNVAYLSCEIVDTRIRLFSERLVWT